MLTGAGQLITSQAAERKRRQTVEVDMPVKVVCPSCSTTLNAKSEWAGRCVKCPKCDAPIRVPRDAANENDNKTLPSGPNWLILGAVFLLSLAVGAAGGVVLGHRQGRSADKRELMEAQSRAQTVSDKLKALEASHSAVQAERDAANQRARVAEEELAATAAAVADTAARRREEETRKGEVAKKVQAARGNPTKVLFKDFANFPEEYAGGCVRFDNVWLDGDFHRVERTRDFSPGVSSKDGKHVLGRNILRFADGAVFVISEQIGRPLSVTFESNKKYGVNLCCEVAKSGKLCIARIYRVETITISGDVTDVFEEK